MNSATSKPILTSIDASGRLVIPKRVREEAGLRPGEVLRVSCRDGRVEIEPAPTPVRIEKRGRVAVAVATEPVPPLTAAQVEATRDELRKRSESD